MSAETFYPACSLKQTIFTLLKNTFNPAPDGYGYALPLQTVQICI